MGQRIEQTLAILNGLVGDYLSRTENGLATDMAFYKQGAALPLEPAAFARAYPRAQPRVVVLVHGLMNTESIWRLLDGSDYGSLLERDQNFSALYVRYNSGLAIAENGMRLAQLLEALLGAYPTRIEEILLIGYSMGGLVIRSACHQAQSLSHAWLSRVRRSIYIGTPHLGAPAERAGKVVAKLLRKIPDPYTRLIADVGNLRSAGLQDLGHADLRHEDRAQERGLWALRDDEHPVPLLPNIEHHLIAGALAANAGWASWFGDSVVPVTSATFGASAPETIVPADRVTILGKLNHLALPRHADVYEAIRRIFDEVP